MEDFAKVCPSCGARQDDKPPVIDNGGFGWGLLGCCVPVAGLVLYLVWKDTKPRTAKAAGIGALVSVVLVVLYYLFIILSAVTYGAVSYTHLDVYKRQRQHHTKWSVLLLEVRGTEWAENEGAIPAGNRPGSEKQ